MKPAPFAYVEPRTLEEALEALAQHGDDGKVLAGGQSLVPLLNMRLAQPRVLIDINRLTELDYVREETRDGIAGVAIGALTRQRTIEDRADIATRVPLLAEAIRWVGHPQIRNRGTVCGSIAHADPAAELPLVFRALDGIATVQSARGRRTIPAQDFFVYTMTPAIEPDELLIEIWLPAAAAHTGYKFKELARRHGDFALVAVAVALTVDDEPDAERPGGPNDYRCRHGRIAVGGASPVPMRATEAEEWLAGELAATDVWYSAGEMAAEAAQPTGDVHADARFRRDAVCALVYETLYEAYEPLRYAPA